MLSGRTLGFLIGLIELLKLELLVLLEELLEALELFCVELLGLLEKLF